MYEKIKTTSTLGEADKLLVMQFAGLIDNQTTVNFDFKIPDDDQVE